MNLINKQRVNITLDPDIVMWFKQHAMNMSDTANSLFRTMIDTQIDVDKDEQVILDQIEDVRSNIKHSNEVLEKLTVELQIVRQNQLDSKKESQDKLEVISRNLRHNNPLRGIDL